MKISTIDKNNWYTMDIEKCEWSSVSTVAANLDIGEHFVRITNQNKNYKNTFI